MTYWRPALSDRQRGVTTKTFVVSLLILMGLMPGQGFAFGLSFTMEIQQGFENPSADCRPHTRWWWMGNATTKEAITRQLESMHAQGIGGVEQITMDETYEKGNSPFLSDEHIELLRHAVLEAKRLGMEFSLNFGGPGWVFGGDWLSKEEHSQNLLASSFDIVGPRHVDEPLSLIAELNPRDPRNRPTILVEDRLVAVVAGQVVEGRLKESTLTVITDRVNQRRVTWEAPPGTWRIMAFWLTYSDPFAVDHFSKTAMEKYCDHVGGAFRRALGDEFGKTIESVFSDSFEVPIFRNGIYWSPGLLDQFKSFAGYDLTRYLPAIWWDVDDISPKIRYDVNAFLDHVGFDAFFSPFLAWCESNGVKGRIQPYGFPTDILKGAGLAHTPEMEITPGEKDAVPWFDTRIGPKQYVASGAHLYGRQIVSTEAYTYLHWEPYRETLEELKIASDGFLKWGATKFYNHGYVGNPEMDIAPTREFSAAIHIDERNVWWRYYHFLSDYIARCSLMLRQGRFVADIAVYSPLANQWTLDCLNARRWTRDFDWGDLGKLIVANGYDFDLINDDVLQHRATLDNGEIHVDAQRYRILVLPNIQSLPVESMRRIQQFAHNGGIVIALERTPETSTGFTDHQARDTEVRSIVNELFRLPTSRDDTGERKVGNGVTHVIKNVIDRSDPLEKRSTLLDPFVNALRKYVAPDVGIDFAAEGLRENDGLTYQHRATDDTDIYFVSNIQDRAIDYRIAFRVKNQKPWKWNAYSGESSRLHEYEDRADTIVLPIRLAPYESAIFVFTGEPSTYDIASSDFDCVADADEQHAKALASANGAKHIRRRDGAQKTVDVRDLPAPYVVQGEWSLKLESPHFETVETKLSELRSWTEFPEMKHFSGTGEYRIRFDLPNAYTSSDIELKLDPGVVGNIAEIWLNDACVGVCWMRGQRCDVSRLVRAGSNDLLIKVTNTLINRVSGMKELPPVPADLRKKFGSGVDDKTNPANHLMGFEPLPRSGLLGPVTITPYQHVQIDWKTP